MSVSVPMAKSRKQILQELLDLENEKLEDIEPIIDKNYETNDAKSESIQAVKTKKPRTEKQLEAFEKAKAIRDANAQKRKQDAQLKADEERKLLEEKVVKKAIAIKKKQIKKQVALDEISDDDTPIQKIKEIAAKSVNKQDIKATPPLVKATPHLVKTTPSTLVIETKPKINFF